MHFCHPLSFLTILTPVTRWSGQWPHPPTPPGMSRVWKWLATWLWKVTARKKLESGALLGLFNLFRSFFFYSNTQRQTLPLTGLLGLPPSCGANKTDPIGLVGGLPPSPPSSPPIRLYGRQHGIPSVCLPEELAPPFVFAESAVGSWQLEDGKWQLAAWEVGPPLELGLSPNWYQIFMRSRWVPKMFVDCGNHKVKRRHLASHMLTDWCLICRCRASLAQPPIQGSEFPSRSIHCWFKAEFYFPLLISTEKLVSMIPVIFFWIPRFNPVFFPFRSRNMSPTTENLISFPILTHCVLSFSELFIACFLNCPSWSISCRISTTISWSNKYNIDKYNKYNHKY